MDKLYLLDVSGFLYRAYHAIQGLSSKEGHATGALFGFIRTYLRLAEQFHIENVVAVFDGPKNKELRLALYKDYKAHRKPTPLDLIEQINDTKTFCDMMGIPSISASSVEADDTIASITSWAKGSHTHVYICSGDKDLAQLVDATVTMINPHKDNLLIDSKKVEELYGVPPSQIADYLAIMGDSSDNIPGLSGFGPKSAVTLLKTYGSLESILNHAEEIGGKKKEIIEKERDLALLSKQLVLLKQDVPFPHDTDFFRLKTPSWNDLKDFFISKNFSSLMKILPQEQKENAPKANYHLINTADELISTLQGLGKNNELAVDTETTDINPLQAELVGVGLASNRSDCYYIPLNGAIDKQMVLTHLKSLLENPAIGFFGHNIKYDLHVFENCGINIAKISFDTILASYLLHAEKRRHSLDDLAEDHFNYKKIATEELLGKGKTEKRMDEVPIDKVSEYCCEDIEYTVKLHEILSKQLQERNLSKLLYDIELPLLRILQKMEKKGVYIDVAYLHTLSEKVTKEIAKLEEIIHNLAGESFNINSPKQLSEILFQKLAIPAPKKGKTMPSTNAEVLETLAPNYPIAEKVLEWRTYEKLRSTYIDSLPKDVNPKTHRIHCQFNQSVAATGRLSCQDPNLQNIPIRTELGKEIRKAFCPEKKGWSFLSADYSQIELRILAHITQDEGLLKAFRSNEDIHAFTASLIFNTPIDTVTEEMRRQAKAVNFGIVYGQQAYGLSQELHISIKDADTFIKLYFQRYPGVKSYIEESIQIAKTTGKATTITGRERLIPEINASNQMIRSQAERLAINTPLQGTAADIIKLAMLKVDRWLEEKQLKSYMILQIHDELLFEAPDEELEILQKGVRSCMEQVLTLLVPLQVEIGIGKNWKEC